VVHTHTHGITFFVTTKFSITEAPILFPITTLSRLVSQSRVNKSDRRVDDGAFVGKGSKNVRRSFNREIFQKKNGT